MSSSLPEDVQRDMLRTIAGLEHVQIMRTGYAIEYDCIDPLSLKSSLEFKQIQGLYSAGQMNGSSGYEEAAAQGLVAGVNAALAMQGKEPLALDRSNSYIGVLIDDLVTKGTNEPYRMMTSRAEYRLLLRQDNADLRLTPEGYRAGLISEERYQRFLKKKEAIEKEIQRLQATRAQSAETHEKLGDLLKRPEYTYENLREMDPERPQLSEEVTEQVEIQLKYEGYITRQLHQIERFKSLEAKKLPADLPYESIQGLRIEAKQKLMAVRPVSMGQASRISGVSPADLNVLMVYLEQRRRTKATSQQEERKV